MQKDEWYRYKLFDGSIFNQDKGCDRMLKR